MSSALAHRSTEASGRSATAAADPLSLCWLDLSVIGHRRSVALSALPRCPAHWDRLQFDAGITAVVTLCTAAEMAKLGVGALPEECRRRGLLWLHAPQLEGDVPEPAELLQLLDQLAAVLAGGGRALLHCSTGLGRTCALAACLLLHADEQLSPEQALRAVETLRGARAVQSVCQYNLIQQFRQLRDELLEQRDQPQSRPVSR